MSIEERLKDLVIEKYGSVSAFTTSIGMSNSTFVSMINRGIQNAGVQNVIKVCQALDISVDGLAEEKFVPIGKSLQESKPMRELSEIIEYTKRNIAIYNDLTIDGEPLTPDDKEAILDAIDLCVEFIKRRYRRK